MEEQSGPITRSNCVRVESGKLCSDAILELGSWVRHQIEHKAWDVLSWNIIFAVRDGHTIANGICTFYENGERGTVRG